METNLPDSLFEKVAAIVGDEAEVKRVEDTSGLVLIVATFKFTDGVAIDDYFNRIKLAAGSAAKASLTGKDQAGKFIVHITVSMRRQSGIRSNPDEVKLPAA